jgi:hypothetical protein
VEVLLSRASKTGVVVQSLAALLYCLLALSCSSGGGNAAPSGGSKQLGERCEKTEECASLLCVRLDESSGVCSKACDTAQACPASDNWDCLGVPGQALSVCACLPLADHEVCGDGLDNDCNGLVDDCQRCDGAPVPIDDHENCGACGKACRADQACSSKECGCPKATPDECGDKCTSLDTDALNCGKCGTQCALGQACQKGECVCDDFVKPDYCEGVGCLDLSSDNSNCGSCENSCDLGRSCSSGKCVCPAGGPQGFCPDVGCLDLATDAKNCGSCGNACDAGQSCVAGKCACPAGQSTCDGTCVDLATDEQNCGECGVSCPMGQACVSGACGCNGASITACGEACADLGNDLDNCGTCGNACADGEHCNGKCECASGVYCGSSCMAANDEQNCGACGNVCPASQYCASGRCECQGFGLTKCGEACYDLSSDDQHCGSCKLACRSGEQCVGGDCQCPFGQSYCEAAGKCVPLATDVANCGSCGNTCNPTETCSSGVCACPQNGQKYCAAQGKCVDIQSDATHCGSCETKCRATEVCAYGSCDCSGGTQEYCTTAKACVDLWTSNQNCGTCDKACPAGTQCSYGSCACPVAGQTLCTSTCFDLQTNAANCGSCGNACTGGKSCITGQCRCQNPSVGTAVRLTDNALVDTAAVAAWDGTHVGVAYFSQITANGTRYNLRFALLNPDGTLFKDVALTSYLDAEVKAAGFSDSGGSTATDDRPAIVWNGSEYGVLWRDYDSTMPNATWYSMKLVRISAAGVPSAVVTVLSGAELESSNGPSVAWSVPYGGYIISGFGSDSSYARTFIRRVGALGTTLGPLNGYYNYICRHSSLAVSPLGAAAVSCDSIFGSVGFFNPDGSRTREPVTLSLSFMSAETETIWDGTKFGTTYMSDSGWIRLWPDGRTDPTPWIELLPYDSAGRTSFSTAWLGASLALATVQKGTYQLRRFAIPDDPNGSARSLHDPITVVPTANVINKPEVVAAGAGQLLAIWQDNRFGATGELYAAPVDLKGCQ